MIPRRYVNSPKRERSNVFVAVISLHEVKYQMYKKNSCQALCENKVLEIWSKTSAHETI